MRGLERWPSEEVELRRQLRQGGLSRFNWPALEAHVLSMSFSVYRREKENPEGVFFRAGSVYCNVLVVRILFLYWPRVVVPLEVVVVGSK